MDADLNKYDLNHVCAPHREDVARGLGAGLPIAWETYYTNEHMETVLRRLVAQRANGSNAVMLMTWFMGSIHIEKIHPLESGLFRFKFRRDRRPGLPILPRWKFYPSYAIESVGEAQRRAGSPSIWRYAASTCAFNEIRASSNTWISR